MVRLGKIQPELMKNARSTQATVRYPFVKAGINVPKGLRARWDYKVPERCTGCKICERVCPAEAIEMIKCRPEDFRTKTGFRPICHLDRCVICGQCVESCPRGVLTLTDSFEMAFLSRDDMIVY